MNIRPIADYLAQKGRGVVGKTIFINEMPASCDSGILLLDNYAGTPIDPYLDGYYKTEFRLVIRGVDYIAATAAMKSATAVLRAMLGAVGTLTVNQCLAVNLPRTYRRSVGGYWEFEVEMSIVFLDSNA